MLSASDLSLMRSTAGAALPDTAVIQSQTYVSDGGGGGTTTWTASGTVPCRVAPVMSIGLGEVETADRVAPETDSVITLPYDTEITEADRLVTDAGTFNVTRLRGTSWQTVVRVQARKLV